MENTMETTTPTTPAVEVYSHPLTPEQSSNVLTAADRCDSCGSQAYYSAGKDGVGVPLLFCRHHYLKHADALQEQGFFVKDQSFLLGK